MRINMSVYFDKKYEKGKTRTNLKSAYKKLTKYKKDYEA